MYVIIVQVIIVHSNMLCYQIIMNVSNIKENTPTCIHKHMHAHARPHVHADLYHNLHKTERLCVFQPALGYHQLVSYNHNHDTKANADFHLLQSSGKSPMSTMVTS